MEILHDHTDKHVQDKEAHQQNEGDKVQQPPLVEVHNWLECESGVKEG
jgi:predicted metal-dependent HD superfamily phosphohydrolase